MLQALKYLGDYISEKDFKPDVKNIKEGDKITIVSINGGIIKREEIAFEKDKKYEYLFQYTGKGSVTGTGGVLGISPFFLEKSKITEEKIQKSQEYDRLYREQISNDNYVAEFFECLKSIINLDGFKALSAKWIYFKEFNNKSTESIHKEFIKIRKTAKRNKSIEEIDGVCGLCGRNSKIDLPRLPFFSLDISNYNFNLSSNDLEGARLKICKNCGPSIVAGWEYINSLFNGQSFLLIPLLRDGGKSTDLNHFIQLIKNELSNFEKLNNLLRNRNIDEKIELFFIVAENKKQKTVIRKLVPNYKTFSIRFEKEELQVSNEFKYVDWEAERMHVPEIISYFDLEKILKLFFVYDKNQNLGEYFHFYQLYNRGIPEPKGFYMDSGFKNLLYLYRDNLFSFIYEINIHALDRKTLNNIILNYILYEIRKKKEFGGENADTFVAFKVMERLNYYYFLKNKIFGDYKMKEQIMNIKAELDKLDDETTREGAKEKILELASKDDRLMYYFIGQFIRKIDNSRYLNKKNKIFDDFLQSINRKNIKQRFAEDILQRQNFYIEKLNPKAKFVFEILKNNLDRLFFGYQPYEEIIISLVTGYYSKDMLKSSKFEEQ